MTRFNWPLLAALVLCLAFWAGIVLLARWICRL